MPSRPVGLSRDLPPKRVMRAEVDGHDVVVWRASDGTIAAWNNRCPHRGMALSHGFVRGNTLACLYHGWHYGASGVCKYIPAHPELTPPETIRAEQYGVAEGGGVIWVSTSGAGEAAPQELAALRSFIVASSEEAVLAACGDTTPLNGQAPERVGEGMFALGADRVGVLCTPRDGGTLVSVLVDPGLSLARRKALSRWCEAMRRNAEKEDAA